MRNISSEGMPQAEDDTTSADASNEQPKNANFKRFEGFDLTNL